MTLSCAHNAIEAGAILAAIDQAADCIVITDASAVIQHVNPAYTAMSGYSADEAVGQNARLHNSGVHPVSFYNDLWDTIRSGRTWHGEMTNRRKDGSLYQEDMRITPVRDAHGEIVRYVAIKRDVTERRKAEAALLYKTALLEGQTETTLDGILVVDEADHIVLANRQFGRMFGIPAELLATGDDLLVRRYVMNRVENPEAFIERVTYLNGRRDEKTSDELKLKCGTVLDRYSAPLVDSTKKYRGRIWYFRDITARRAAEERSEFLAFHDALTGLPHRALLQDRLNTAFEGARRRHEKIALLFLDLDRFKSINDTFGHSYGDDVLKDVARRLREWAREQDTVARLGGDEFLVMLNDIGNEQNVITAAERIMDAMKAPFLVQGHSLSVSCSIGISIFPEHGTDGETLIKNADAALYSSKDCGRGSIRFFTGEMNAQATERLIMEENLRLALERQEFFLEYQPQVGIESGAITGFEALIRWHQPGTGLVMPDKFISVAENSGLIVPIGEWVLRTACAQARKWLDAGLVMAPMAVNVSAAQFSQVAFLPLLRRVLAETRLPAQLLELELTEGLLFSEVDLTSAVMRELKEMGVKLAIDDFGTGYSSLSYLKHFRVEKLKIDRSFIRDVATDSDAAAITVAIISLARNLKIRVLAEGVENETQVAFLRQHRCDEMQGYYFSRPMPADKVQAKLSALRRFQARAVSDTPRNDLWPVELDRAIDSASPAELSL